MDVIVRYDGHVKIHDVSERGHVDAARSNIGRHQHTVLAALEASQRLGPLRLRAVAVNSIDINAMFSQIFRELVRPVFRTGEHERVVNLLTIQQLAQQGGLEVLRHGINGVRDPDGGRRSTLEVDGGRVREHLPRQLRDGRRHRGAEEQRLPSRRQMSKDAADVRQKTHVEHPVGLVEHQILQPGQPGVREAEMIQEPSRRSDHDIHAAAEGVLLRSHPDAAKHRRSGQRRMNSKIVEVLHNLRRQFARRRQHQRARGPARLVDEAVQNRQQKGRRLAAAGHRARQHVAAGHRQRNRVGLDGGRPREAEVFEPFEEIRMKPEAGKRHGSL
jgi:hypothetical protein